MATCFTMPQLSLTMIEGSLRRWLKHEGEPVSRGEPLVEVEADKATIEVEAPADGILLRVCLEAGLKAPVGTALAWIGQPGEIVVDSGPHPNPLPEGVSGSLWERVGVRADPAIPTEQAAAVAAAEDRRRARRASPVARRLATQHGLDLEGIVGSGPAGAIVEADIRRTLAERAAAAAPQAPSLPGLPPTEEENIPLTGVQRAMADRVALSRRTMADVTTVAEVDMTEVVRLRSRVPASFTAYVGAAVMASIAEFPLVNSSFADDHIVRRKQVHLGVAVAAPQGLLVVVVREAGRRILRQIHTAIEELAERARTGTITPTDTGGATFTVTNSGVFGSLLFTPVIDPPQAATLGMGKVMATPVVRDGQIVARDMMYLCLSYDHRVLDGATAVRFLQKVKSYLEAPLTLLGTLPDED